MAKVKSKKVLPKAQLGTIVKTIGKYAKPVINATKSAIGYTKPAAKSIIKDTKVAVRPINRSAKPVAKKLDPKVAEKFIVNKSHAKNYRDNDRSDLKALKVATAVTAAPLIGAAVKGLINKPKDTSKVKAKPKKK